MNLQTKRRGGPTDETLAVSCEVQTYRVVNDPKYQSDGFGNPFNFAIKLEYSDLRSWKIMICKGGGL